MRILRTDDLELGKEIDLTLNLISSRSADGEISFVADTNAPDAWTLSGRYEVAGDHISVSVNIKQNKAIKNKFTVIGSNIKLLAENIVQQASSWILNR